MARLALAALLFLVLPACQMVGTGDDPPKELTAIERAGRALESGEVERARADLLEHLDGEPEDHQARYLLARTLAAMGEVRGARAELTRAVELAPENPLYWSLLARLHEQLGDHTEALRAYGNLLQRVPESLEPVRGIARCQLFLGRPEAALAVLRAASERPNTDAASTYLTYLALRRLGRMDAAEEAARSFLEQALTKPAEADRARDVRRWLTSQSDRLEGSVRQAMVDYVRAACRLRLPGATGPEEAVLESSPERLFLFDDRPVFVALYPPQGGPRFRGRGRGNSLAAALKGAVDDLQSSPGYAPLLVRQAAVRIDVGQKLEPAETRQAGEGLELVTPFARGREGIAIRADGKEVFALPSDVLVEDLRDLSAILSHATRSGGLAEDAWYGSSRTVFVFETDAFVSHAPGAAPVVLLDSEPLPLPLPSPRGIEHALAEGAGWLTTLFRTDGTCAPGYRPRQDSYPDGEFDLVSEARMAALMARLQRRLKSSALLAASRHALDRAWSRLADEPSPRAQAWLLLALAELDGQASPDGGADPDQLARALAEVRDPEAQPSAAVALLEYARLTQDPSWSQAALALWPREAILADDSASALHAAYLAAFELGLWPDDRATLAEWAQSQLAPDRPPLTPERLTAFARVARRLDADPALRDEARNRAGDLLTRQLAERHRWFLPAPSRALGGFRLDLTRLELDPVVTIEALEALLACDDLLR